MLKNTTDKPCEIVEPVTIKKLASDDAEGDEPEPPEPFEYIED